jgi:hypothetical protein
MACVTWESVSRCVELRAAVGRGGGVVQGAAGLINAVSEILLCLSCMTAAGGNRPPWPHLGKNACHISVC